MTEFRGIFVTVVVVVPAFAVGQGGDEPVIGRSILAVVVAVAKGVRHAVDHARNVGDEDQAEEHAPDHKGPAADQIQQYGKCGLNFDEVSIAETVKRIVDDVLNEAIALALERVVNHQPAHVTPPKAINGSMGIAVAIDAFVVGAVIADPNQNATLSRERTANHENIFQPLRHSEAAVSDQTVVADRDAEATGDPPKEDRQADRRPRKILWQ